MRNNFFKKLSLFVCFNLLFTSFLFAQNEKDSVELYRAKLKVSYEIPIDSALYFYDKLIGSVGLKEKANLLRKKGLFLIDNNLNKAAEREFLKALVIVEEYEFKDVKSKVYHDLGYHYYILNNSQLAYKYFLLSKGLYKELNDVKNLSIVNTNIGTFLSEEGDYEEAEKLYYQSLDFYEKTNDTIGIIYSKINLASLMRDANDYDRSNEILESLVKETKFNKQDESLVIYNFALNAKDEKHYNEANEYVDKAIRLSEEINDDIQLIDLHYLKAEVELGKLNYPAALDYFNKSLKTTIEIDDLEFKEEILKRIIEVKIRAKDFGKIDSLFHEISIVQDTLSKRKKYNSYKEILLENQINKNEETISLQQTVLEKEKKQKKLYFILSFISLLSLVLVFLLFYSYRKNSRKNIRLMKHQSRLNEIELANKRKIEKYEKKSIQDELNAKNKELQLALLFTRKRNENLIMINSKIDQISGNSIITKDHLQSLKHLIIEKSEDLDKEEGIQQKVVNMNKDFFRKLLKEFPSLTQTELKILAYIRVNMDTKEIATIQNVSVDAIRKTRYRIRKKLELEPKQSLEKYILQYY